MQFMVYNYIIIKQNKYLGGQNDEKVCIIEKFERNESSVQNKFWKLYNGSKETQKKMDNVMTQMDVLDDVDNGGLTDKIAKEVIKKAGLDE